MNLKKKKVLEITCILLILTSFLTIGYCTYKSYKSKKENKEIETKVDNYYNIDYLFNNDYIKKADNIKNSSDKNKTIYMYLDKTNTLHIKIKNKEELNKTVTELPKEVLNVYYSKIDDETYINFADLILNNPNDVEENIAKIRNSLVLMKDGQAVFTNLEKLYLYRYVFSKGKVSDEKIDITKSKIEQITDKEVRSVLMKMMEDAKSEEYKNNSLLQDKLLWVAREYQRQGINYAEISVTWIVRKGEEGAKIMEELHDVLPKIEAETGVKLRFLGSFSRTLMTEQQLKVGIDVL